MSDDAPNKQTNFHEKVVGSAVEGGTVNARNIAGGDIHEHHHYPAQAEEKHTFPLHHIPHPQNPNFTGREQILQQVAETLAAGQTTVVTQTIAGLGGVGKTQLALAYSYAHLDDYALLYWLSADSEAGLGEDVMALARRLKLIAPEATDQQAAIQAALHWLGQTSQRWLLVYDNADQIEPALLAPYLPRTGNGHVLITSRNPNYGGLGQVLELGLFELDEAVAFLFRRKEAVMDPHPNPPPGRGRGLAPAPSEGAGWGEGESLERKSKEWQEAAALAQAFGRLPLALEHAAAYVASKGSSYAKYHQLFAQRQNELWQRAEMPERYHATITTTWELAFDEVKKTPGALELLNLCCFLDPEGIPLALIKQIAALPVETLQATSLRATVADELALDDALEALRRYSLMQRAESELNMHRLVQAVARSRMDETLHQNWLETAVKLLVNQFNYDQNDMSSWAYCGELLPHVTFVVNLAQKIGYETSSIAYLNNDGGRYLQFFGNFSAAKPFLERAAQIYESINGPDHPHTATSLNNLSLLLQAMGDLAAARPYLERALAIRENTLSPDHPDTAQSLNNLGLLLQDMGDLAAARPYVERALAICEKALGPDHPYTATSLNNLGLLLQDMGDLAAARPYYERALAIREKALGPDHPYTATSLNNLAWLYHDLGEVSEAVVLMRRVVHTLEKAIPNHQNTATARRSLAYLEAKQA